MNRVDGIRFRQPERSVIVVRIDGGDPSYHQRFLADGIPPNHDIFDFAIDGTA